MDISCLEQKVWGAVAVVTVAYISQDIGVSNSFFFTAPLENCLLNRMFVQYKTKRKKNPVVTVFFIGLP